MTRAEYHSLHRWYRTLNRRRPDSYQSTFSERREYASLEEAARALGVWRQSEFGRWLGMCADRRRRTIEHVSVRRHRTAADAKIAALDLAGMSQMQRINAALDAICYGKSNVIR